MPLGSCLTICFPSTASGTVLPSGPVPGPAPIPVSCPVFVELLSFPVPLLPQLATVGGFSLLLGGRHSANGKQNKLHSAAARTVANDGGPHKRCTATVQRCSFSEYHPLHMVNHWIPNLPKESEDKSTLVVDFVPDTSAGGYGVS